MSLLRWMSCEAMFAEPAYQINAELAARPPAAGQSAIQMDGVQQSMERQAREFNNPWKSGSFYLVAFVIVAAMMVGIVVAVSRSGVAFVPTITFAIAAIVVALVVVAALQLRNDRLLSEKGFLSLIGEVFRSLADALRHTGGS